MEVRLTTIPLTMKRRPQWVLWRRVERKGMATKVPFRLDGKPAGSNRPEDWVRFIDAADRYIDGGYDGLGFVFTSGLVGVDLDKCRDANSGRIEDWARRIIVELDSYAEVSPSRTGVKIVMVGQSPFDRGRRKPMEGGGIEVYDKLRYFCMTGWRLPSSPCEPQDRQDILKRLAGSIWPPPERPRQRKSGAVPTPERLAKRLAAFVAKAKPAVSGCGGHNQTFSVACALVLGFGLDTETALEYLRQYNERCLPPWSERELRHKIDSAAQMPGERGYMI